MKKPLALHFTTALIVFSVFPAFAAGSSTVTLDVQGMDCAVCPITVRKALEKVPGVSAVKVDFKTKRAIVSFDPAQTAPPQLTKAAADAGYPSSAEQVQQ
ncbi:mercury resistance system periplasmic binding protein MerP [Paraburkholderia bryophila]|uniref:Periplasmic mercury ion-binding protein n=1 Tax=Paraburkholderia bryophila TaxID=420952 RepID=A0A7Z0B2B4_9BURK|nr:mercury resistance system periplasmic binding protein MerP [Paraburkholderia bryophila]NYH18801.1 mercuric ion binding protein [Paraburkholderia bryophila]